MDEYGNSSGYPMEVQLVECLCVESTNASSELGTMSFLSRLKVRLGPLLYEYGYESPCKTHYEAQEPEGVDQNCGFRGRKFRRIRRGGMDDGLGGSGIGEKMINISEIEFRVVL
jgi:hypothetical protein